MSPLGPIYLLQTAPNCSRLLQIHREDVAGCARYADQPEINTGGIREEDNECDEGKLGRQKKFNQETRVQ